MYELCKTVLSMTYWLAKPFNDVEYR